MSRKASSKPDAPITATIGFKAKLWLTADKLRNNMYAAEHKHVVLSLIFLKYISDTGESKKAEGKMMKAAFPRLTSSFILQTFPMFAPYTSRIYAPACGSEPHPHRTLAERDGEVPVGGEERRAGHPRFFADDVGELPFAPDTRFVEQHGVHTGEGADPAVGGECGFVKGILWHGESHSLWELSAQCLLQRGKDEPLASGEIADCGRPVLRGEQPAAVAIVG